MESKITVYADKISSRMMKRGFSLLFVLGFLGASFMLLWLGISSVGVAALQQKKAFNHWQMQNAIPITREVIKAVTLNTMITRQPKTSIGELQESLKWALEEEAITVEVG